MSCSLLLALLACRAAFKRYLPHCAEANWNTVGRIVEYRQQLPAVTEIVFGIVLSCCACAQLLLLLQEWCYRRQG